MNVQLSSGFIERISQDPQLKEIPQLQVLEVKQLAKHSDDSKGADRQRLVISDGQYYQQGMLASQMNNLVNDGKLKAQCIIQLNNYIVSAVNNKSILIILDCQVVDPGPGTIIGDPTNVAKTNLHPGVKNENVNTSNNNSSGNGGVPSYMTNQPQSNVNYNPIASLNPYQNRWTIKARVTSKSNMRTWNNAKGEGQLFSIDLLDAQGGQIRATMFNDAATKFNAIIQENKVYSISRGSLKIANKRFNTLPNEYELTLNADAEIMEVGEDRAIEEQKFQFVSVDRIESIGVDENLDLYGIVKEVQPLADLVSKKTNKELKKRTITITDQSLMSVDVTLWGDLAVKYNEDVLKDYPIISLKNLRVSDYGGRTLNCGFQTQVFLNMDKPEVAKLRAWWDEKGQTATFQSISKKMGGGGSDKQLTFQQVKDDNIGHGDKPDYFVTKATITFFRKDMEKPCWYNACPNQDCNKKLQDSDNGAWFCEKCNKEYPAPRPRYVVSLLATDGTSCSWLTAFDDAAVPLLNNVSASDLAVCKENNDEAGYASVFDAACFRSYNFKIRAKAETRDDETRLRCTIVSASPINYVTESKNLLNEIANYN